MSFWRQLSRGLRVLGNRSQADREIDEEFSHFLDEATSAGIAAGLSPGEARRAARLQLGTATAVREQVRGAGWENRIETLFADMRYAIRRLAGNPGFTAVSLVTLAMGIGASTAIFSVIESVLLRPLPFPDSGRLVALLHTAPGIKIPELNLAASLYFTYREESRVFQHVGMWTGDSWTVTGLSEPEQVTGISATHGFLAALEVPAALGRGFTAADEDPKGERTVMLSDGYWKSHFSEDRDVLGKRLLLDGEAATVIGVLPAWFQFMDRKISLVAPIRFSRTDVHLISFCCQGVARLKPGVTLAQANADAARMLPLAPEKFPLNPGFASNAFFDARIAPRLRFLKDVLLGDIGNTLWVLMGTVGIVLSIACANVANLMLVRADGRRHELAIRAALGAGWTRIARELLLESILLGLAGGALGLGLAYAALRILVTSELPHLPRLETISIDATVVAFTAGLALLSGVLFGLIPVLKYARPQVTKGLPGGGRTLTWNRQTHRTRNLLLVTQVALALVLLVGSGLMIRTSHSLRRVDPGFAGAAAVETFRIGIPDSQVKEQTKVIRMEEEILRKIEAISGVGSVAISSQVPLDGGGSSNPVEVEDQPNREGSIGPIRGFRFVSPGYVKAIGSRLIAGREPTWAELYSRAPVAMVSENMARELWREPRLAVGRRIRASLKDDWREVVGVVADLRDLGIDRPAPSFVYWPLMVKNLQARDVVIRGVAYVVRTPRAGSAALRRELQQAVASVNAGLPVANVKTLESVYERSLARTSFTLALLMIAGSMALLLGVVGIYGVISYSVAQRRREVGIRIALGAPLTKVTSLFVRHGVAVSAIGTACGLIAALALTRLMKSLLFGVNPADPLTYIAAAGALIFAAIIASYLPARRATRIDPVNALRAE